MSALADAIEAGGTPRANDDRGDAVDTKSVLDRQMAAFTAGNVDGILQNYTDASVLITPDATIRGREALREAFEGFFSGLFTPGTYDLTVDALTVEGEVAYIVWRASCASAEVVLGTDTLVVRDGKIATQTFAAKVDPR